MAMFREAALYTKLSVDHMREASQALARYGPQLDSKSGETVLDIGSGPGDVTRHVIFPALHPSFSLLVGVDVSSDMVDFAKERWPGEERISFRLMDAAEHNQTHIRDSLPVTSFDKIFSFYALQWVSDRRQLALNLSTLLTPGGQALLVLVVNSGVYLVWDTLVKSKKWSSFFQCVKVPLNEYQYMDDPGMEIKCCLENAGLEVTTCDVNHHTNAFSSDSVTDLQKLEKLKSVDPLVCLIPDHLKDDYMTDVLEYTKKLVSSKGAVDYTSMAVICRKPLTTSLQP